MDRTVHVSVVVPVFNEEGNLNELTRRCAAACESLGKPFEIVLVDDGSSDKSAEKIAKAAESGSAGVVGVFLNRNYGQHAAVMAGFEHSKGQIVVTLDADLQNPPEEIPRLVRKAEEGFDVVGSVRVRRRDTPFRKLASGLVNKLTQKATGVPMNDYGCMLRAYKRHIVDAMLQCRESSTFIPALANSFAKNIVEIDVDHSPRTQGESKYSLWKLINLQFDLMTGITTFPLRLLSILGGFFFGFGLLLAVYILAMRIIHGTEWAVGGVFTLFAVLFFFIGAQFVGLGLIGEYIGRIYRDVRGRPRYFVEKVVRDGGMEDEDFGPGFNVGKPTPSFRAELTETPNPGDGRG